MADKPRVLLTEPIFPEVEELLREHTKLTVGERGTYDQSEYLIRDIGPCDGILTMLSNPVNAEVIRAGKNLKIIANHAVGFNNIDADYARKQNIRVANTPDVLTKTTADGIMALMLATARRIPEAERALLQGSFDGWHPTGFLGMDFPGKKLGIIGMGRIGLEVARRAKAFEMEIHYHNRKPVKPELLNGLNATYHDSAESIAAVSDILSLSCPLTNETHHLINADILKLMKPTSILINASRGPVVNEGDLARALIQKTIGGAGLDVYEFEPKIHPDLLNAPNCVLLPHITSATAETRKAMGMLAAGALLKVLCDVDMECYFVV